MFRKGFWLVVVLVMSLLMLVSGLLTSACKPAGEKYPTRTITLVVPWPAGGRTDLAVRAWADSLEKEIGVPVVVANKAGGAGIVGAEAVASAAPDGYTMGLFSISHIYGQYTKVPSMDFSKFDYVGKSYSFPLGVNVHKDALWKNISELVAYSKQNPGKVKIGHSGPGGSDHVFLVSLAKKLGVEWQFIPYAGDAPAVAALATKEIDINGAPLAAIAGMLDAKTIRVLGVTTAQRYTLYPDAPTLKEQGVDMVVSLSEYACAPKGTPADRIEKFNAARQIAMTKPEVTDMLKKIYVLVDFAGPDGAKKYVEDTSKEAKPLIEELGLYIAPKK